MKAHSADPLPCQRVLQHCCPEVVSSHGSATAPTFLGEPPVESCAQLCCACRLIPRVASQRMCAPFYAHTGCNSARTSASKDPKLRSISGVVSKGCAHICAQTWWNSAGRSSSKAWVDKARKGFSDRFVLFLFVVSCVVFC